jgi:WD40 repeat protein
VHVHHPPLCVTRASQTVRLWRETAPGTNDSWSEVAVLTGHTDKVNTVVAWLRTSAESGDGDAASDRPAWAAACASDIIASGARDGEVRLWCVPDGALLSTFVVTREVGDTCEPVPVYALAFREDGSLVAGGWDGVVRIVSATGHVQQALQGHRNSVSAVAALHGGGVVSASFDTTLLVWQ